MERVAAVVLAAGKGTRMRSGLAKVLHPMLGRPLLAYPLDACRAAGVGPIVVVVGHQAGAVEEALAAPGVSFAFQPEQQGTSHAVLCAAGALEGFEGTALILCGDVPLIRPGTLRALADAHRRAGALLTVLTMEPEDSTGYGRVVRDGAGRPARIVEEADASPEERAVREVNTGTYAAELPWLFHALETVGSDNRQGEVYLTDALEAAAREGRAASVLLDDPDEVMGVNSRAHLARASAVLRERINLEWMEAGVTLEDPATTWIEPGVRIEADVTIGPGCRLAGGTRVCRGTRIDTGCVITDSEIGPGCLLKPYCVLTEARLEEGAQVGPFAHLRPGAVVGPEARVGNFVEMKKTVLGRGSKANHLTYLGDTTVGEGANIGAGTITCNYDGTHKHPTRIGNGAFIGSNSSLVAPVAVGDEATVAAGSTITKDVPDGALGVGRGKQRNVEGWARRKR